MLYNFLSAPIDSMTEEEKQARKEELLKSIKNDIDCAYGPPQLCEATEEPESS